jgi:hypothetical protein
MGLAGVLACAHVERAGPVQFASSVKFRDAAGEVSFRIKPEDGDVRVEDDDGDLLVELRAQAAGLAISSGRRDLGLVQPLEGRPGFRVVTEQGGDTVLELRIEPDGDLSLRDGAGEHLYKAKRRDYGFKILDAEGNVQAKVRSRSRSTKTAVRNAAGETYLSTRDPIPAAAVATLALDDVRFAHAVALAVAIVHWGIPGAPGATLEEAAPES